MEEYIKIGTGSFFVILGLYLINKFSDNISVIGGIACIAIGIGIIASSK